MLKKHVAKYVFCASFPAPPEEISLVFSSNDESEEDQDEEVKKVKTTNVTCLIKGVFPEPQVQLTWKENG